MKGFCKYIKASTFESQLFDSQCICENAASQSIPLRTHIFQHLLFFPLFSIYHKLPRWFNLFLQYNIFTLRSLVGGLKTPILAHQDHRFHFHFTSFDGQVSDGSLWGSPFSWYRGHIVQSLRVILFRVWGSALATAFIYQSWCWPSNPFSLFFSSCRCFLRLWSVCKLFSILFWLNRILFMPALA